MLRRRADAHSHAGSQRRRQLDICQPKGFSIHGDPIDRDAYRNAREARLISPPEKAVELGFVDLRRRTQVLADDGGFPGISAVRLVGSLAALPVCRRSSHGRRWSLPLLGAGLVAGLGNRSPPPRRLVSALHATRYRPVFGVMRPARLGLERDRTITPSSDPIQRCRIAGRRWSAVTDGRTPGWPSVPATFRRVRFRLRGTHLIRASTSQHPRWRLKPIVTLFYDTGHVRRILPPTEILS